MNNTNEKFFATFIEVAADVRYWDDAEINGISTEDGLLVPFKNRNSWCPIIKLQNGQVIDWPIGTTADIHFKICDSGEYWLLDENKKRVAKWGGYYVPDDFLGHGDIGYGDYIILKIDLNGMIENYRNPPIELFCGCDDSEQQRWKKLSTGVQG